MNIMIRIIIGVPIRLVLIWLRRRAVVIAQRGQRSQRWPSRGREQTLTPGRAPPTPRPSAGRARPLATERAARAYLFARPSVGISLGGARGRLPSELGELVASPARSLARSELMRATKSARAARGAELTVPSGELTPRPANRSDRLGGRGAHGVTRNESSRPERADEPLAAPLDVSSAR